MKGSGFYHPPSRQLDTKLSRSAKLLLVTDNILTLILIAIQLFIKSIKVKFTLVEILSINHMGFYIYFQMHLSPLVLWVDSLMPYFMASKILWSKTHLANYMCGIQMVIRENYSGSIWMVTQWGTTERGSFVNWNWGIRVGPLKFKENLKGQEAPLLLIDYLYRRRILNTLHQSSVRWSSTKKQRQQSNKSIS